MIRVLVVDPDRRTREQLNALLSRERNMKVIGLLADGFTAYKLLKMHIVDVLIMEINMPRADGFTLLKNAAKQYPKTHIIILTEHMPAENIDLAAAYGADFYMIKPFVPTLMLARLRDYEKEEHSQEDAMDVQELNITSEAANLNKNTLSNLLLAMGIPASINGYHYLRDAVLILHENKHMKGGITTQLYPYIAKANNTTACNVERSIRHAIVSAWDQGQFDRLYSLIGCEDAKPMICPTNGALIALLADRLSTLQTPPSPPPPTVSSSHYQ